MIPWLCVEQNFFRGLNRIYSPRRVRQRNGPLNVIGLKLSEAFGDFLHQLPFLQPVINGESDR
jgi:hypothetical protein